MLLIPSNFYGRNFWTYFPNIEDFKFSNYNVKNKILLFFPKSFIDVEKENLDLEFEKSVPDKNSIKMLYKIWRCNEIKKKIERKNGIFDCVVRNRCDAEIKIFETLVNQTFKNNEIFIQRVGKWNVK